MRYSTSITTQPGSWTKFVHLVERVSERGLSLNSAASLEPESTSPGEKAGGRHKGRRVHTQLSMRVIAGI